MKKQAGIAFADTTQATGWQRFVMRMRLSVIGNNPVVILVSGIFHFCLIVCPLFLLPHVLLLEGGTGIRLWAWPEAVSHVLTEIVLLCGVFFLLRRLFVERVRAISSLRDYFFLILTLAPFLTGYLAYYQVYDYDFMLLLHMLSAEILLIVIPFTMPVHMVYFVAARFFQKSEYSLRAVNRKPVQS